MALTMLSAVWWKFLVWILFRMARGVKLLMMRQQKLGFALVDSFRVKDDLSIVIWLGECWGKMGSVIEVVMVIMTSDSTPMGGTHRLSTGEIILFLVDRVLELNASLSSLPTKCFLWLQVGTHCHHCNNWKDEAMRFIDNQHNLPSPQPTYSECFVHLPSIAERLQKKTMTRRKAGYQHRTRASMLENDSNNESEEKAIQNYTIEMERNEN